jgi:hypothetical protein
MKGTWFNAKNDKLIFRRTLQRTLEKNDFSFFNSHSRKRLIFLHRVPPKLTDYPYEFNGMPYEQPGEACFYEVHLLM